MRSALMCTLELFSYYAVVHKICYARRGKTYFTATGACIRSISIEESLIEVTFEVKSGESYWHSGTCEH